MHLYWCAAGVVGSCFLGSLALGSAYPDKPVRFIVAFPPSGNADLIARVVGQGLTNSLGRTFVIDNRGGAGGIIGEELAAKAAPDGYTILLVASAHVVNPSLHKKLPYDPVKDLVPVSLVASMPKVLVVQGPGACRTCRAG